MPELRDYQTYVIDEARKHAHKAPIIVLPTGAGKSVVAAEITRRFVGLGRHGIWLAHRKELVDQGVSHVRRAGVEPGIIMAGVKPREAPMQVASTLSLVRRPPRDVDVLLYDEAHHSPSATGQKIIDLYPDAIRIGFTATPARLDGRGLKEAGWGHLILGPTTAELIERGFLAPYRYFGAGQPDMSGVKATAGDYNKKQAGQRMRPLVGRVPDHYREYITGGRAIVFAVTVEHSKAIQQELEKSGISCEHADAKTPKKEREAIMDRFRSGETRVLTQVQLVDEGFDVPECDGVILARPTQSLTFHRQSCGRALRPKPDGSHAIIVDMAGNWQRLGMPDEDVTWSLEGRTRVAARQPWRMCKECFAIVPIHSKTCALCGSTHVAERRGGPIYRPGRLREVSQARKKKPKRAFKERDPQRRADYWRQLMHARARGHKIEFARLAFQRRNQRWPYGMKDLEEQAMQDCPHVQMVDATCRFCGRPAGLFEHWSKP